MKQVDLGLVAKYAIQAFIYAMVVVLAVQMLLDHAEAKTVAYGSNIEQVRIKFGGPTVFRFQKAVQTITGASRFEIKPANPADPTYTVLAVTPRFTNGVNEVSFFLADSTVVRTRILVSPNDPAADSLYDFKSRDSGGTDESENAHPMTEVELLKAMVRDAEVAGQKLSRVADRGKEKKAGIEIELTRIYRGAPFNGYVYRLVNVSGKNVEVDVRHVAVGEPNLAILAQSDAATLFPKGKGTHETFLRIVTKNTASSRDVVFALEPEDGKKKESR